MVVKFCLFSYLSYACISHFLVLNFFLSRYLYLSFCHSLDLLSYQQTHSLTHSSVHSTHRSHTTFSVAGKPLLSHSQNCSDSRPRDIYSAFPPLISKKDLKFRLADRVLPESTSFRLRLRRNEFSRLGAFFTHDYRVYTI